MIIGAFCVIHIEMEKEGRLSKNKGFLASD